MEQRTPAEVLDDIAAQDVAFVDFRFCDLPGVMQHVTIPAAALDEAHFEAGHPFDGSSVRGFQQIQESDMILIPDPDTGYLDPFRPHPTLVLHCFVADPVTGSQLLARPPLRRPEGRGAPLLHRRRRHRLLRPRARVLRLRRRPLRDHDPNGAFYQVDSVEGQWNTGRDERPNLGYKPRTKQGYFPVPPMDQLQDLRSEMALNLETVGIARRAAPPRGGHRRPGRDRHPLRHPAAPWPTS